MLPKMTIELDYEESAHIINALVYYSLSFDREAGADGSSVQMRADARLSAAEISYLAARIGHLKLKSLAVAS